MPDQEIYTITLPTATVAVSTKGGGSANNGSVDVPVPIISNVPIQVAGLAPMVACDANECRSLPAFCCEKLNVFGNTEMSKTAPYVLRAVTTSTYENDLSDFLFDVQLLGTVVTWSIEKCSGKNNWANVATISNQTYGKWQALATISGHTTYTGFTVNWGRVLFVLGIGVYRIKFSYVSRGTIYSGCFVSPEYNLRKFNCDMATRTVKFECIMPDLIGNTNNSGYLFDMCGMSWFSSLRIGGFFGTNTVQKYDETFNKFDTGQMQRVHDEAIKKWKWDSLLLSKPFHDRLSVYMMMAKNTLVSDYNILNVDYTIKQLSIIKAGAYEPTDYNNALPPKSSVSVDFNAGIQNIIASNCCNLK